MSIGYMGYVKLAGSSTINVLASNCTIAEVITPIYSGAVHGAGWIDAGPAYYADDIVRYDGGIDFDLTAGIMGTLGTWSTTLRANPITAVISPDGSVIYTFTSGTLTGIWNSSLTLSTSEGSMVTASCSVVGLGRVESDGTGYIENSAGQAAYPAISPIPYWQTKVTFGGVESTDAAVDWSFEVNNNPILVYACTGVQGPIAVLMGEASATATVSLFNVAGVDAKAPGYYDVGVMVGAVVTNSFSLPKGVLENDGNDLSGGDAIINRVFTFNGLSSKIGGVGVGPFKMG